MISTLKTAALLCACIFTWAAPCRAGVVLTLVVKNNVDLTKLTEGYSDVAVDLVVSGVEPGMKISYLTVSYSLYYPRPINSYVNFQKGPALGGGASFHPSGHGSGDYSYTNDYNFTDTITNGVLASFDFGNLGVGSGTLYITANMGIYVPRIIPGPNGIIYYDPVPYTTNLPLLPIMVSLPEPGTWGMVALGIPWLLAFLKSPVFPVRKEGDLEDIR